MNHLNRLIVVLGLLAITVQRPGRHILVSTAPNGSVTLSRRGVDGVALLATGLIPPRQ